MAHGHYPACGNFGRIRLSNAEFLWSGNKRAVSVIGAQATNRKTGRRLEHAATAQNPIGTPPEASRICRYRVEAACGWPLYKICGRASSLCRVERGSRARVLDGA